MVKKKTRKKKGIFGSRFDAWDLLLLALIFGSGWYILSLEGVRSLIDTTIRGVFFALIIGTVVRFFSRRSGR